MKPPRRQRLALAAALLLATLLAACGTQHPYDATAENDGYYVRAGQISYQLQVSRELNPFATEDRQYLTGLPSGTKAPLPDQLWYGVFLYAINDSKQPVQTTDRFDIVDTQGNVYHPVALDSSLNQYAWTAQTLRPHGDEPPPDTTASFGPTQGGLVLFKLSTSVYANRPLTLQIHQPGQTQVSTISLDL